MDINTMQTRSANNRPSWDKPALQNLAREVESASMRAMMGELANASRECGMLRSELDASRAQIAALQQALQAERDRPATKPDPDTSNTLRAIQVSVDELLKMETTEAADGDDTAESQSLSRIENMLQQLLARESAEPPELGEMRFEFVRDAANLPIAIVYKP